MSDDTTISSGAWRGYYLYERGGRRHAMSLDLTFTGSDVRGHGDDDVGSFTIRGGFDPDGVRVWWTKSYARSSPVEYDGVRDGANGRVIYGGWTIRGYGSGGFRIWRGAVPADVAIEIASESVEVDEAVLVPVRAR